MAGNYRREGNSIFLTVDRKETRLMGSDWWKDIVRDPQPLSANRIEAINLDNFTNPIP
jgi:hypothetical protein